MCSEYIQHYFTFDARTFRFRGVIRQKKKKKKRLQVSIIVIPFLFDFVVVCFVSNCLHRCRCRIIAKLTVIACYDSRFFRFPIFEGAVYASLRLTQSVLCLNVRLKQGHNAVCVTPYPMYFVGFCASVLVGGVVRSPTINNQILQNRANVKTKIFKHAL